MGLKKKIFAVRQRLANYWLIAKSRKTTIEVGELFFQHNGESDFMRYDMIVRLLAVENYFGENDFGFDLYRRMQGARINKNWVEPAVKRFRMLIQSYEKNGYDEKSSIILDQDLHLVDGSHRMAMAMYYGIQNITVSVRPKKYNIFYGIEWFHVNGFSDKECEILTDKYHELKARYATPFVCSLWSPVHQYYDEITEKLRMFGEVSEVRDYDLSDLDYSFYTRGIYHVDDIEKWKIEKKIDYMRKSAPGVRKIRMVTLFLNQPNFRLKAKTQSTLSQQCELIKRLIRDAYKEKVDHYYHDIVMHIGDNFRQNRHIYRLLTMPPIDVSSILQHISNRRYVLTKIDSPYMPSDFPSHYPLGKDIDIICADMDEYQAILGSILKDVEAYKDFYSIRFVKKYDQKGREYRTLVRLEQEDQFLVFLFDVATQHRTGKTTPDFIDEMIATRLEKGGYFIPSVAYEIIIRLKEYHMYPQKVYHMEYVRQHIANLDKELCYKYLDFNWGVNFADVDFSN